MKIQSILVCTSKGSKLNKIYRLITGDEVKKNILNYIGNDLIEKKESENDINVLSGTSLIEDISYYINLNDVESESYLYELKEIIYKLIDIKNSKFDVLKLKTKMFENDQITNFDKNELIRFFVVLCVDSIYLLHVSRNALIKNTPILDMSVTKNSTMIQVDQGIKFPQQITARFDKNTNELIVYDVNRFETMLLLNENKKEKAKANYDKFKNGDYKIAKENFEVYGLDDNKVEEVLMKSKRAVRRLAKYDEKITKYEIEKIINAVKKLDGKNQVVISKESKKIYVTEDSAKTFVGILHNVIVERLISEQVEVII